jgi:hypothetical protein
VDLQPHQLDAQVLHREQNFLLQLTFIAAFTEQLLDLRLLQFLIALATPLAAKEIVAPLRWRPHRVLSKLLQSLAHRRLRHGLRRIRRQT